MAIRSASSTPRPRSLLWPLAALLLVLTLFFWPVWLKGYRCPPGSGDTWKQLYPVWSFIGEHVSQGALPLWNSRMMGGEPVVGEPQYGLLNPLNWPMFLSYPIPEWVVFLRAALPLLIGGVGMYVLLRRSATWRLGRSAAVVGSVAYMLSDPFIVHLGHPQFNDVLAWFPWCLAAVDWVLDGSARAVLGGLPLALLGVAGHAQAALHAAAAISLYALWRVVDGPPKRMVRRGATLLIVAAVGLGLAAPILLPAIERYPFTERAALETQPLTGYQWPLEMLVDIISPWFHGRGAEGLWMSWGRTESAYAGMVTLCLCLLGLAADRRRRRSWFLVVLAVLGVLVALGHNGPLFPLLAQVDVLAQLGKTSRAAFLVAFALSAGAALGVHHLLASDRLRRMGIVLLLVAAVALWFAAPAMSRGIPAGERYQRAVGSLRAAAGLAVLLALALLLMRGNPLWAAAVVVLLAGELIVSGAFVEAEAPAPMSGHDEALTYLREDSGWFRVDVDSEAVEMWPPHSLVAAGFAVPRTVGNPMELRAFNLFYWGQPSKTSVGYRLLGVKYIVVRKDAPPGGEGIAPVFIDDPLVDLHLHTTSLPRAWLVYRTAEVDDLGDAMTVMSEPGFDPWLAATVEDGPLLEGEGEGTIELLAYEPNRVALEIRVSAPAFLVLSDVLYPGWEATLDGDPVPIYLADGVFRGVAVPAGGHLLEMNYRPGSLRLGLGLAAMTTLMVVSVTVFGFVQRRRKRTSSAEGDDDNGPLLPRTRRRSS